MTLPETKGTPTPETMDSEEGIELGIRNLGMDDIELKDENEVKDPEKMENGKENSEDKRKEKENYGNNINSRESFEDNTPHDTAF